MCFRALNQVTRKKEPNQALERNAIALHFLLSDAAHGVAHF
jgi:hypothetical protein